MSNEPSAQNKACVLIAAGEDRPGIVDRVSGIVYQAGCNLEDSRMSILGGEFALIVLITGDEDSLTRVEQDVARLKEELGLTLHCKRTHTPTERSQPTEPHLLYTVHAVAMDHPGIVHKLTNLLASEGANVAKLDTTLTPAPTTGTPMFSLHLDVLLPAELSISRLRSRLQRLSEEENIDVEVRASEG